MNPDDRHCADHGPLHQGPGPAPGKGVVGENPASPFQNHMSPAREGAPRQPSARHTALSFLALWAIVLSLESWFRPPGSIRAARLPPQRLVLDGVIYERDPAVEQRRAVRSLPSAAALVRHWTVSYRRRSGPAMDAAGELRAAAHPAPTVLHMAYIQATGSGKANRLPIGRIEQWMGELADVSGCVISRDSEPARLLESSNRHDTTTLEPPREDPWRIPLWLLGLQGIEEVNCVWIGSDRRPSPAALSTIAGMAW